MDGGRETLPGGATRPRLASDSAAALQRNCALGKCTGVSNAWISPAGPPGGPGRGRRRADTPPRAPNLHQEAAEALGKPTVSLRVRCHHAGKLPRVGVRRRLLI